jgi:two-component system NarL family sensor kinase
MVEESESYIDEAMKKLRQISFNMMPQILQRKGLEEALNELIEMLAHATALKINYECAIKLVDKEKRIHIYRVVQEILNNISKHANATIINFSIKKIENKILLHIQDNGTGFDKNVILKNSIGLGLQNIMARIDLLKARIYLSTEPGKGVDYLIEIPDDNASC